MLTIKTLFNSLILVILLTFVPGVTIYSQGSCDLTGFRTFTQGGWGSPSNSTPGGIRDAHFNAVFPSGAVMGGNFTATFTSASAVKDFLPQGGPSAAFNANYTNPSSTSAGVLGGQVMALLLNVKYDEAGFLGTNPLKLKDLIITTGTFAGKTVGEFLTLANAKIGGGSSPYSFSDFNSAATSINENFDNGTVNKGFLTCSNSNPASLGDKVWNDINKNGIQDNGEAGIPDVTVKLYDCFGILVGTTTTNAIGNYHFNNIPASEYYVEFTPPAGYVFTSQNQGLNDELDSDVDPLTGKTVCKTLTGGTTDNSIDAGLYYGSADLQISKSVNSTTLTCGQNVSYTVTITNNGPAEAGNIIVSDILPAGLLYVSSGASQGTYTSGTGDWTVGTLGDGNSATLTIDVTVDCSSINIANIDLGPAKPYNVFVLENILQPSADTEGKLAVGGNANLSNYSVGDKLPNSNGAEDVLVVGGNLFYTSGRVYNGNVAFGGFSNLPIYAVSIEEGTLRHDDAVIDFVAARAHLENLSTQLASYAVNGTTTFQWGTLNLTHNDPYLNVFSVNAGDLNAANTFEINVPNGAAVVVNILGNTINWHGGLFVNGTAMNNVLYNFPEATSITVSGIDVKGSFLAPFADLTFPAGIITGQTIVKSMTGSGQFNLAPFLGNIPTNQSIINVASITNSNISDPNSANNSASATANFSASINGGGSGSGNWQQVSNFPVGQVITCLESDGQGNLFAGTASGYIYKRTGNSTEWVHVNPLIYSGAVWSLRIHPNGNLFAATVTGVYVGTNNGMDWAFGSLQYKDVRTIKVDANGNLFAGTWGFGVYRSMDNGLTWAQVNTGIGNNLIITGLSVNTNNTLYAGTFGGGVFKSVDQGSNWTSVNNGYNFIWTIASDSDGDIFAGTYGDGLYRSADQGATWVKTNFPGTYVYEMRIDDNDNIYAASYSGGVFISTDNGNSWSNIGLGGFGLSSLLIVPNGSTADGGGGVIYGGTANGNIYMAVSGVTDAKNEKSEIPSEFVLSQNYPNPFNPSTRINVSIPADGFYEVSVFSITGELVSKLVTGQLAAGVHSLEFNASNLPSGIYIYRLSGDGVNITKKMTLMK